MSFLELVGEFLTELLDPEMVAGLLLAGLVVLSGLFAIALHDPLGAALVLAPVGGGAAFVGWRRTRASRARERPQPVYLGVLPDATVLVAGKASALIPAESPVTKTPCVYWCVRVVSGEVSGDLDDGGASLDSDEKESGVFLIDDGQGRALVWPDGRIRFAAGWHESLKGDGFHDVAERLVAEGATVSVVGRAGSFETMMTEMLPRALELTPDLLKALQTRPELRSLPCFWPRNQGEFLVAEGSPEALMAEVSSSGETLFLAGLTTLGFSAVLLMGVAIGLF